MNTQRVEGHTPIANCPNPECRESCRVTESGWGQGYKMVICGDSDGFCGYEGPMSKNPAEAIRLHNLICNPTNIERLEKVNEALVRALERLEHFTFNERWAMKGLDDDAQTVLTQVKSALSLAKETA